VIRCHAWEPVVRRWLDIGYLTERLKELAAIAAPCALLEVLLGHQSRDFLRQSGGHELIDGDSLSFCEFACALVERVGQA
jgi:hypothetical protein